MPHVVPPQIFRSHAGILYGKHALLENLFAYKVRPATNKLPGRFETGTQNHEGVAGVLGAIKYFEWVGREFGGGHIEALDGNNYQGRGLEDRVAIFSFRLKDMHPRLVAEKLAGQGIYVWDGNYYALNVTERLGLEDDGGMVRGALYTTTPMRKLTD